LPIQVVVGGKTVEVPPRAARTVRGGLVGSRAHETAGKFSQEHDGPVVLSDHEQVAVLKVVFACMQSGSDQRARDLLPLRKALREHLGHDARDI
jgi:hypothetical protein